MVVVTKVVAIAQDVRNGLLGLGRVQGTSLCAAMLVHGQNSDGMRGRSIVIRLENAHTFVAHSIRECFLKRRLTNLKVDQKKNCKFLNIQVRISNIITYNFD